MTSLVVLAILVSHFHRGFLAAIAIPAFVWPPQIRGVHRRCHFGAQSPRTIADSLLTVRQLRLVVVTPRSFSAFAANLERPMPSGACK
jgi:hypothetical protein